MLLPMALYRGPSVIVPHPALRAKLFITPFAYLDILGIVVRLAPVAIALRVEVLIAPEVLGVAGSAISSAALAWLAHCSAPALDGSFLSNKLLDFDNLPVPPHISHGSGSQS
jgi:hypothetical protein